MKSKPLVKAVATSQVLLKHKELTYQSKEWEQDTH